MKFANDFVLLSFLSVMIVAAGATTFSLSPNAARLPSLANGEVMGANSGDFHVMLPLDLPANVNPELTPQQNGYRYQLQSSNTDLSFIDINNRHTNARLVSFIAKSSQPGVIRVVTSDGNGYDITNQKRELQIDAFTLENLKLEIRLDNPANSRSDIMIEIGL